MRATWRSGQYGDRPSSAATASTGGYEVVTEGYASVLFPPPDAPAPPLRRGTAAESPKDGGDALPAARSVFYNEAQVVNRDLSVCVLETFARLRSEDPKWRRNQDRLRRDRLAEGGGTAAHQSDGITVLEALSASGLRAIRYWREVEGISKIIANDLDPDAVRCIERNIRFNGLPLTDRGAVVSPTAAGLVRPLCGPIVPNCDNAIELMQRLALPALPGGAAMLVSHPATASAPAHSRELLCGEVCDAIDLDPYGTAVPFLESAMGCIAHGGLLLVTCTDSAILCGNYPETCRAKYNSLSLKLDACHEFAARVVLAAIEQTASRQGKYIEPLLALHIDFYVRVFVRVYSQPAEAKISGCKLGYVAQCNRCPAFWTVPTTVFRHRDSNKKKRARRANHKDEAPPRSGDGGPSFADDVNAEEAEVDTEDAAAPSTAAFPSPPSRTDLNGRFFAPSLELVPQRCTVCGSRTVVGGPIYCAPYKNSGFLDAVLGTMDRKGKEKLAAFDRVRGLVLSARDELPDCPLFYRLPQVASTLRIRCPMTAAFTGALSRLGYRCSQVHCDGSGVKTDAPAAVVFGVMMHIRRQLLVAFRAASAAAGEPAPGTGASTLATSPVATSSIASDDELPPDGSVGHLPPYIVVQPVTADATYEKNYDWRSCRTGVSKFVPNAPRWGPKPRHVGTNEQPPNLHETTE